MKYPKTTSDLSEAFLKGRLVIEFLSLRLKNNTNKEVGIMNYFKENYVNIYFTFISFVKKIVCYIFPFPLRLLNV